VPRFVHNGQTGYCTPVGDDEALWYAVESLCVDKEKAVKMGESARKIALTAFHRPVIADQTLGFYHVMGNSGTDCQRFCGVAPDNSDIM
jgi:hypothetical protein